MTKGDLKKSYLEDKGLTHFSKDDKKIFAEAVKITLKELASESNTSSKVENVQDTKVCITFLPTIIMYFISNWYKLRFLLHPFHVANLCEDIKRDFL